MKTLLRAAAAGCLMAALASPCAAGQVKLDIRDGLVTLHATDATLREILAEWARVGGTNVVNAERAPSTTLTLELEGVPEQAALDTLLRSTAGFIAAPKTGSQPGASIYSLITLMPGARPAVTAATTSTPTPQPQTQASPMWGRDRLQAMPQLQAQPTVVVDDQDDPAVPQPQPAVMGGAPGSAQPGMTTQPTSPPAPTSGSGYANPYGVAAPSLPSNPAGGAGTQPALPTTATRPGMPTPSATPQPGQPGQPIKGPDKKQKNEK